ncbi:LysE family translocator [Bacillus sp. FJAT-47783]|uniref:LysE family translocator n=1 Tax=Bacillus sp. FJAT-47783 TaxID=2922712 RepID=UPI001FAD1114
MDGSILLAFLGASILLTLAPGPDNLFVISQSMSYGFRAGFSTSLGLCTGLIAHTTFAALGLSAVLYQSSLLFQIIKILGAIYLIYLAYQAFKEGKQTRTDELHVQKQSYRSLYKKGILMNIFNPKVSLFFLAFLPQFVSPTSATMKLDMFLFGIIFIIQAILLFTLFSALSSKIRTLLNRSPFLLPMIHYGKGVLFAVVGMNLLFSERT